MKRSLSGFTLIELMMVVVIIGILAAIAYPSFMDQIRKSRRADAEGALMGFAGAMERHFTQTGSYCDAGGAGGGSTCGGGANDTGSPSIYATQSPLDGDTTYYDLTINAATASTYTLRATPTGTQAIDHCGTLTLTNTGQKGITGQDAGYVWQDCW